MKCFLYSLCYKIRGKKNILILNDENSMFCLVFVIEKIEKKKSIILLKNQIIH